MPQGRASGRGCCPRGLEDGRVSFADANEVAEIETVAGIYGGIIAAPDDGDRRHGPDEVSDQCVEAAERRVDAHADSIRARFFQHPAEEAEFALAGKRRFRVRESTRAVTDAGPGRAPGAVHLRGDPRL